MSVFVFAHMGTQLFSSTVVYSLLPVISSNSDLGQKSDPSVSWTRLRLIACSHENRMERLRIVPLFVPLFYRFTLLNGTMLFEALLYEHNPWVLNFLEQNDMERNNLVPVSTGLENTVKLYR